MFLNCPQVPRDICKEVPRKACHSVPVKHPKQVKKKNNVKNFKQLKKSLTHFTHYNQNFIGKLLSNILNAIQHNIAKSIFSIQDMK